MVPINPKFASIFSLGSSFSPLEMKFCKGTENGSVLKLKLGFEINTEWRYNSTPQMTEYPSQPRIHLINHPIEIAVKSNENLLYLPYFFFQNRISNLVVNFYRFYQRINKISEINTRHFLNSDIQNEIQKGLSVTNVPNRTKFKLSRNKICPRIGILRRWFRIRAKNRYKYVFGKRLEVLPKRSLTKVLPWSAP